MAFTPAEAKDSSIVADECDAFAGIAGLRAEIARLNPHRGGCEIEIAFPFVQKYFTPKVCGRDIDSGLIFRLA
jgi:hypothetical protein